MTADDSARRSRRRRRVTTTDNPANLGASTPRLIVMEGPGAGRKFVVDAERVVVGRGDDADVRVDDPQMSRLHAELRRLGNDMYEIVDLGSSNGTFLNGAPVEKAERLKPGDKIRFGNSTLVLFTPNDPVEEQLLQRQRLEALGRLAAGIAHDFNNMLGAVLANIEYLGSLNDDRSLADHDTREALGDMEAAAKRAAELSRRLLGFARGGGPDRTVNDATDVMREVTQVARRTFGQGVEIASSVEGPLWVAGSALELHQVLMNLCLNARDAMPAGGKLSIDGRHVTQGEEEAVEIRVTDTGGGMASDVVSRIFDPFFTTKPSGAGFGLGLSTVREIVALLGGSVTVDSKVGAGTTFAVTLPAARAQKPRRRRPTEHKKTPITEGGDKKLTVLLVDDEEMVRRGARRLLTSSGISVLEACDGSEAVRRYAELKERPDVVMLDLEMPGMDGTETLAALRELDDGVRVIFVSGHRDPELARDLRAKGALAFVHKPWTRAELLSALDAAARKPKASARVDSGDDDTITRD